MEKNVGSKEKSGNGDIFRVGRVIYEDEYALIECGSIDSKEITFQVTSKMENRKISIIILDGLGVDMYPTESGEVQPGETIEYKLKGELNHPEHKLMSLSGDLYDDTGSGFAKLDICDFDLGGKANQDYEIQEGTSQLIMLSGTLCIT